MPICTTRVYNASMVHRRQLQIDVLRKVNIKGRARFLDRHATRNLRSAFVRKTTAEATLLQHGLVTEEPLLLLQLMELPATLDALDPPTLNTETIEALDDVDLAIDRLRARGTVQAARLPNEGNELLALLVTEIRALRSELATGAQPRSGAGPVKRSPND